jgi:hypothetical protein
VEALWHSPTFWTHVASAVQSPIQPRGSGRDRARNSAGVSEADEDDDGPKRVTFQLPEGAKVAQQQLFLRYQLTHPFCFSFCRWTPRIY